MPHKKKKPTVWDDPRTRAAQKLAYKGFTQEKIRRAVDLTPGQTQYRLQRLGISTTSWRNADTEEARALVARILKSEHLTVPRRYQ